LAVRLGENVDRQEQAATLGELIRLDVDLHESIVRAARGTNGCCRRGWCCGLSLRCG